MVLGIAKDRDGYAKVAKERNTSGLRPLRVLGVLCDSSFCIECSATFYSHKLSNGAYQ